MSVFTIGPSRYRVSVLTAGGWVELDCAAIESLVIDQGSELTDSVMPLARAGTMALALTGADVVPWPWPGSSPDVTVGTPIRVEAAPLQFDTWTPLFTGTVQEWNVTPWEATGLWRADVLAADLIADLAQAALPAGLYFDTVAQAQWGEAHTGPVAGGAWLPTPILNHLVDLPAGGTVVITLTVGSIWASAEGDWLVHLDAGPGTTPATFVQHVTTNEQQARTYSGSWTLPPGQHLIRANIANQGPAVTDLVTRNVFAWVEAGENVAPVDPPNPYPLNRLGPTIANLHRHVPGFEGLAMDVTDLPTYAMWQARRVVLEGGRLPTSADVPPPGASPADSTTRGSYWSTLLGLAQTAGVFVFIDGGGTFTARRLPLFAVDARHQFSDHCSPDEAPDGWETYDLIDRGVDWVTVVNRTSGQRKTDVINAQPWRFVRTDQASLDQYGLREKDWGDVWLHEPGTAAGGPPGVSDWLDLLHQAGWGEPHMRVRSITVHQPDAVTLAGVELCDTADVHLMVHTDHPGTVRAFVVGRRWELTPGMAQLVLRFGIVADQPAGEPRQLPYGRSLVTVLEEQVNPAAVTGSVIVGVTDHGSLTGLGDDDHPQYLTDTRGDARYVQAAGDVMSGPLGFIVGGSTGVLGIVADPGEGGDVLELSSAEGVAIVGPYLRLDSQDPLLTLAGAAGGSPLIAAGFAADGSVRLGWGAPLRVSYEVVDSTGVGVLIKDVGVAAPSPWVPLGLTVTVTEDIPVNEATWAIVLPLANPTTRTGTVELGYAADGGPVTSRDVTVTVAAQSSPRFATAFPNRNPIPAGTTVELYARVLDQSNAQFTVSLAATVEDPALLRLTWTGASGGAVVTDHGALTGLGDDDHPQYVLAAGDTMTGPLTTVRPLTVVQAADQLPAALRLRHGDGYTGEVGYDALHQLVLTATGPSLAQQSLTVPAGAGRVSASNGFQFRHQAACTAQAITPVTAWTQFPLVRNAGTMTVDGNGILIPESGLYAVAGYFTSDRVVASCIASLKLGAATLAIQTWPADEATNNRFGMSIAAVWLAAGQYVSMWALSGTATVFGSFFGDTAYLNVTSLF